MRHAVVAASAFLAACSSPGSMVGRFPDTIQSNNYSCGVAAVQAVLQYHGIWGYADTYAREMGTTEADGTHPARMVECLRTHGLDAVLREGLTIADLKHFVDQGIPVIIDFQAWNEDPKTDYSAAWEDGHYGVVIGYRGETLYIEDPSLLGTVGELNVAELERRWRDYEEVAGKRREYVRAGIVVRGKVDPPPRFTPIE